MVCVTLFNNMVIFQCYVRFSITEHCYWKVPYECFSEIFD